MNKFIAYLTILAFSINYSLNAQQIPTTQVNKVILLIGDGMGLAQVYGAMVSSQERLNLERSQFFGYSKTFSANDFTTDSGAGGTAISTGKKTNNKFVAMDPDSVELKTILEYAQDFQYGTGLISTSEIVHATPASFASHSYSRYDYTKIAYGLLHTAPDVIIGGGKERFDTLGLLDSLKLKGYDVSYKLNKVKTKPNTKIACLAADGHLPKITNGRGNFLPDATQKALEQLSYNKNGFFLLVEGSQIDWGGHDNDLMYVVSETIDFDKAVGVAYDYADANPGTLVIVTADHETGGLTLPNGSIEKHYVSGSFSTGGHTGLMVPVFAYGTGAQEFSAIMDNTELFYKMMGVFGFEVEE